MNARRQSAKRMGFLKRHWSNGQRKAAEGLFNDAEAFVFNLVPNDSHAKFSPTPRGEAIDKRANKNGQVMAAPQVCFEPGNG